MKRRREEEERQAGRREEGEGEMEAGGRRPGGGGERKKRGRRGEEAGEEGKGRGERRKEEEEEEGKREEKEEEGLRPAAGGGRLPTALGGCHPLLCHPPQGAGGVLGGCWTPCPHHKPPAYTTDPLPAASLPSPCLRILALLHQKRMRTENQLDLAAARFGARLGAPPPSALVRGFGIRIGPRIVGSSGTFPTGSGLRMTGSRGVAEVGTTVAVVLSTAECGIIRFLVKLPNSLSPTG